jgi:hypothetical protein
MGEVAQKTNRTSPQRKVSLRGFYAIVAVPSVAARRRASVTSFKTLEAVLRVVKRNYVPHTYSQKKRPQTTMKENIMKM